MTEFSETDRAFMARALELAWRGQYSAHPNPMVGCVIANQDELVGEGWHMAPGEAHAEVHALESAGTRARGGTVYVTLEPCSHQGRTPPCTEALIRAGVARVIVGTPDPNPAVNGAGIRLLEQAGIRVSVGLLQSSVEEQIRSFARRMTRGRPFVRLKIAASIDGCVAMADGCSQWITGPEARADVQRLRAGAGAVMTGIGTVLSDDPSLTVRDVSVNPRGRQPLRVVLDNRLRMPKSSEMLTLPGETLVYCIDSRRRSGLVAAGAQVVKVAAQDRQVDIAAVLDDLGRREINEVLVEAGPILSGNLLSQGFVDEIVIYQAPHIMGSETIGMFRTPAWTELRDRRSLDITDVRAVGGDTRITARVAN